LQNNPNTGWQNPITNKLIHARQLRDQAIVIKDSKPDNFAWSTLSPAAGEQMLKNVSASEVLRTKDQATTAAIIGLPATAALAALGTAGAIAMDRKPPILIRMAGDGIAN
jgi:hypothetical protein